MKYCHHCAAPLVLRIPEGDELPRHCCDGCESIFYQNPKNIVGTVPIHEDKVLLCKRAIQPRLGRWTLPAGYDCCAWQTLGSGQFRPLQGSRPFLGEFDKVESVAEYKVEMVCAAEFLAAVITTLKQSHPYEEPAYSVVKTE